MNRPPRSEVGGATRLAASVAAVPDGTRVDQVLVAVVRQPWRFFIRQWNWKAALLSSATRATLFLLSNVPAGWTAALRAMAVEFAFRAVASGVLGSLTQSLRHAQPAWAAGLAALVLMPVLGHSAEYLVHVAAGTPRLGASMTASIAFTCVSTLFNLFAMRRGVLVVGAGAQTLWQDLRALPGLVVAFAVVLSRRRS